MDEYEQHLFLSCLIKIMNIHNVNIAVTMLDSWDVLYNYIGPSFQKIDSCVISTVDVVAGTAAFLISTNV